MVRQFGFAKSLQAHVFLPVDVRELGRQVYCQLLIDNGVGSRIVEVGFFHTGVEERGSDGASVGEGHHTIVHHKTSTYVVEKMPMVENILHGNSFVMHTLLLDVVVFGGCQRPSGCEIHTLGKMAGSKFFITIVREKGTELVGVVAFAMIVFPLQKGEITT